MIILLTCNNDKCEYYKPIDYIIGNWRHCYHSRPHKQNLNYCAGKHNNPSSECYYGRCVPIEVKDESAS